MSTTNASVLRSVTQKTGIECIDFDALVSMGDPSYQWITVSEWSGMVICYTSGTTGMPKGVVYSHRSCCLHAMTCCMSDTFGISSRDCMLLLVPMYHVMGWCLPYSAMAVGTRCVFLGRHLTPDNILAAFVEQGVTFTQGVPTVMAAVRQGLEKMEGKIKINLNRVLIGGSKPSPELLDYYYSVWGVESIQAWGMTEMNPIGTLAKR